MSPQPTRRRENHHGRDSVVFERTFRAPAESVWAAVTDSDRLARWIGTWSGDPASGSVVVLMNGEGNDAEPETYAIEACEAPRLLVLRTGIPVTGVAWHLVLELTERGGITTLTFSQSLSDAETAGSVAPGWASYLDRLVAAETGGDVAAIGFDDYFPAQAEHYRAMFAEGSRRPPRETLEVEHLFD